MDARTCGEYKHLLFVDFEKAFDCIEFSAVLRASAEGWIIGNYVKIDKEANAGCSADNAVHHPSPHFNREKSKVDDP